MDKHLTVGRYGKRDRKDRKDRRLIAKNKISRHVSKAKGPSSLSEANVRSKAVHEDRVKKARKALASKDNLVKTAYKLYAEDYMRFNKTASAPVLKTQEEVQNAISPYLQAAAEKLPPEIYDIVPALAELNTDNLKEAAYGLAPTVGGMIGSAFGPEGKIIGQIGGEVLGAFIKWGIEEDGFEKIGDFVADAVSEIGDFVDDAVSEVGSFISDVGSALDLW